MEDLPIREWVVIFYPQTGAARLCPTLDFARNALTSSSTFNSHVYRSPNDFRVRHDHVFLEKCWRALHKSASWMVSKTAVGRIEDYDPEPPDVSTEQFVKMLWEFLQDVGDRLTVPKLDNTIKMKENYELKLSLMHELMEDETRFKKTYNNQARTLFTALCEYGEQFLTEDTIKRIVYELIADRKLKTKQKPWVIMQYYRPQFIKDGYIVRGREPRS